AARRRAGDEAGDERSRFGRDRPSGGTLHRTERSHRDAVDGDAVLRDGRRLGDTHHVRAAERRQETEGRPDAVARDPGQRHVATQRAKASSSRLPAAWLFSGWNCTAKILSVATAAAKSPP